MNKEEFAIKLFLAGHIKIVELENEVGYRFKLHEEHPCAPLSRSYINMRGFSKEIIFCIGKLLYEFVQEKNIKYDRIVGLPKAGEALAEALAKEAKENHKLIFLKKEESESRRRILPHIIGPFEKEEIILVFDDLISAGHTKIEGIKAIRGNNLIVTDCVVLIDRQQGGIELLQELGVEVHFLLTLAEILEIYIKERFITEEVRQEILAYPKLVDQYIKNKR